MSTIETVNQSLFLALNATPQTSSALLHLGTFIAKDLILLIPVILLGMWLWGDSARRNLVLKASVLTAIALGINLLIGLAWPHPRPFMIGLGHAFIQHAPTPSFPSDHGTIFAMVGITLLLGRARQQAVIILCTGLAVAWARIFVGVHYPLDMVGALVVSGIVYLLASPVWRRVGEPLTLSLVQLYRKVLARPIAKGWLRH